MNSHNGHAEQDGSSGGSRQRRAYLRFGAMIACSTAVMYGLTYSNLFSIEHARWSEERAYMAILMGSAMAVVMLGFMWTMYASVRVNLAIIGTALVLGGTAFGLLRTQALVEDEAYMKSMIPHHSIAVLTSERAGIEDLRVRELAEGISRTQIEEIKQMTWLLADIAENGKADTAAEAARRPAPRFSGTTR